MSQNPTGVDSSDALSSEDLRAVATRQKVIIGCISFQLLSIVFQFVLSAELRPILGIVVLAVGIVATVFVFLLATKIYNMGLGVLLGILTFIPLIGLIVLLIVNAKATGILKQNGIQVGLFGAKM